MAYKISYQNRAGELDCRVVATEEETRDAALDLIAGMAFLCDGDKLVVTVAEIEVEADSVLRDWMTVDTSTEDSPRKV